MFDHIFKARLKDRDFAIAEALNFGSVIVNADDFMTQIRKASARNKPHIACSNHGNPHCFRLRFARKPLSHEAGGVRIVGSIWAEPHYRTYIISRLDGEGG